MKGYGIVFLSCLFLSKPLFSQSAWMAFLYPEETAWGTPALIEDFDGVSINPELWYNYYPWGGLSLDSKTYTDARMCKEQGGSLWLSVDTVSERREFPSWMVDTLLLTKLGMRASDGKVEINRLTSALWSKKTFKYGYFECRCWLPKGQGYWPAFWMYGGKPNEELDFMEAKGERTKSYHVDVHCPNRCDRIRRWGIFDQPFGHWVKTSDEITETWVTFAGLWTPLGVVFYCNDEAVASHEASFNTEMNLIANFSLAMDKGAFSPGPNRKTVFPGQFRMDYIRAWEIPKANEIKDMGTLTQAPYIRCVHKNNHRFCFEFSNTTLIRDQRAWIEKDSQPFIELDLTVHQQLLDYTYWPEGTYVVRIKNGAKVSERNLIIIP
jgi:beta-glucanase (GH16 family)